MKMKTKKNNAVGGGKVPYTGTLKRVGKLSAHPEAHERAESRKASKDANQKATGSMANHPRFLKHPGMLSAAKKSK